MFKKIRVLSIGKKYFGLINGDHIFQNKEKQIVFINSENFEIIKTIDSDISFMDIFFCDNKYYGINIWDGGLFKITKNIEVVNKLEKYSFVRFTHQNCKIIFSEYDGEIRKYMGVFDISNYNEKFKKDNLYLRYARINDDYLYCDNALEESMWKYIDKYDINTGELLWRYGINEISNNDKVNRLIGVHKNILVGGIGTNWLFGIDTNSGKLAWKRKTIPNFDKIDKKNDVLHTISVGYVRSDIFTGKILDMFDDSSYFEDEVGIESQRSTYVQIGDHLITTDWRKGRIGAFNTLTHRFDWIHDEPGVSFPGLYLIRYYDPYLFLMDNKNNLHIFKRE